jgi:thioredoxin-related protein
MKRAAVGGIRPRLLAAGAVLAAVLFIVGFKTLEARSSPPPATDPRAQIEWARHNRKPAMILFHSGMCEPCRKMDALVQMVRRDYQPTVTFIEVATNDEANWELVVAAEVRSIPTAVFLSASGEATVKAGLMTQAQLRAELARLASGG